MSQSLRTAGVAPTGATAAVLVRVPSLERLDPAVSPFPPWLRAIDGVHRSTRHPLAVAVDAAGLVGAGLVAGVGWGALALAALVVAVLYVAGCYARRPPLECQGFLFYPSAVAAPYCVALLAAAATGPGLGLERGTVLEVGAYGAAWLVGLRAVTWTLVVAARRRGLGLRSTLVVGQAAGADLVVRRLREYPEAGLLPTRRIDPPGRTAHDGAPRAADIPRLVRRWSISQVVVVADGSYDGVVTEYLANIDGLDLDVAVLPPLSELFLDPRTVTQVGGLPFVSLGRLSGGEACQPGKRLFDVLAASTLLLLFAPVLAVAAAGVKLGDRGPVLYRQARVGHGGRVFQLLKFRSMAVDADRAIDLRDCNAADGLLFKVRDDPRVTPVGRVLRRLSIDELPQLWNVVRGEMSLVGPRPLAVDPDDFGPLDGLRHRVLPGITGYWQVSGGNGLTYQEMVKLDLAYIQNWSLWLDLRLLVRTVPALLSRREPW